MVTTQTQETTAVNGTLELGKNSSMILVKFNFTNPKHIPPGIPRQGRYAKEVMDAYHASIAAHPELSQVGRHREGRVDTGEPVISNLQPVQVALVRKGLVNNGYRLIDAHYYQHPKTNKYVVVLTFGWCGLNLPEFNGDVAKAVDSKKEPVEFCREIESAMRSLATSASWVAHVWMNPTGIHTINLVKRQPDVRPMYALVARGRQLKAVTVSEAVAEQAE